MPDRERRQPRRRDRAPTASGPWWPGTPVVVRRHAGVAALVGATASAIAIAYLWRASQTMTVLDWALCGVMAVIAAVYLSSLVDSRTPLLVADELGVRIRLGDEWRGLPWEAIDRVTVHPRRGLLRDGRLVVTPRNLGRALEGLDGRGRRHAAANQKMYGAALAVPVGHHHPGLRRRGELADQIAALALGRAEVVEVAPESTEAVEAREGPEARQGAQAGEGAQAAEGREGTPGHRGADRDRSGRGGSRRAHPRHRHVAHPRARRPGTDRHAGPRRAPGRRHRGRRCGAGAGRPSPAAQHPRRHRHDRVAGRQGPRARRRRGPVRPGRRRRRRRRRRPPTTRTRPGRRRPPARPP